MYAGFNNHYTHRIFLNKTQNIILRLYSTASLPYISPFAGENRSGKCTSETWNGGIYLIL